MTVQSKKTGDVVYLTLDDELNIYTAAEQKEELFAFMDSNCELEIDLSNVSEIDSAGLQILMLLKKEAENQDKQLRLANHSQAVFELFELLDVTAIFGDPVVIPAGWQQ